MTDSDLAAEAHAAWLTYKNAPEIQHLRRRQLRRREFVAGYIMGARYGGQRMWQWLDAEASRLQQSTRVSESAAACALRADRVERLRAAAKIVRSMM